MPGAAESADINGDLVTHNDPGLLDYDEATVEEERIDEMLGYLNTFGYET